VVGIGINVHHREGDFPADLRDAATSIELATGRPCDRGRLLRDVLTRLDDRAMVLESGAVEPFRSEWVNACGIVGKRIRSGGLEGTVTAVDDHGAMTIDTAQGPRIVVVGEAAEVEGGC
jgi:BirA family biotin operon repressor/biotin-[acetyl-CoA-carboxylase] ligase